MAEFLLSVLPIAVLFLCLLIIKLPAKFSSGLAFLIAFIEFIFWFRPGTEGIEITISKGIATAVFVGLIALGAMLLYNLVDVAGGFTVINDFLSKMFRDRFALFIMITWTFSAFLQGIAGYGIPAVISATILVKAGYDVSRAAAASLLGHSWAITFGSMGSSIFAIDMVTDTPVGETLVYMSYLGSIGMLCCGIGVCFIYGGFTFVMKGIRYILPAWIVMSLSLIVMAYVEMVSVIGFVTGMIGIATMILLHKLYNRKIKIEEKATDGHVKLFNSVLPYIMVILMSIGFFIISPTLELSFSFSGYQSELGVMVEAEEDYVTFNILKYPFTIIVITTTISIIYYLKLNMLRKTDIKLIITGTVKKIKSTEITLLFLLCTASIMMDSGMTTILSTTIVEFAQGGYAIMSSVIGMLGAFITGSNTNANILFGYLQETAAISLGISTAIICALQSVSASIGGAIGPTTTALVAAATDLSGRESEIYRHTLAPTILITIVLGAVSFLII